MSELEAHIDQSEAERIRATIERHARCLEAARLLFDDPADVGKVFDFEDMPGTWWEVPTPLVRIVGCMLARVA